MPNQTEREQLIAEARQMHRDIMKPRAGNPDWEKVDDYATMIDRLAAALSESQPDLSTTEGAVSALTGMSKAELDSLGGFESQPPAPSDDEVALLEELRGWGFSAGDPERARLSKSGHQLFTKSEGSKYVMASSTYHGADVEPHRPFLAVVHDVLTRFAAGYRKAPTVDAALRERVIRRVAKELDVRAGGVLLHGQAETVTDLVLALVASSSPVDRAAIWDEGYAHAGHESFDGVYDGNPETSPNPYRALATVQPTEGEKP